MNLAVLLLKRGSLIWHEANFEVGMMEYTSAQRHVGTARNASRGDFDTAHGVTTSLHAEMPNFWELKSTGIYLALGCRFPALECSVQSVDMGEMGDNEVQIRDTLPSAARSNSNILDRQEYLVDPEYRVRARRAN
jgi:hypothetical protein